MSETYSIACSLPDFSVDVPIQPTVGEEDDVEVESETEPDFEDDNDLRQAAIDALCGMLDGTPSEFSHADTAALLVAVECLRAGPPKAADVLSIIHEIAENAIPLSVSAANKSGSRLALAEGAEFSVSVDFGDYDDLDGEALVFECHEDGTTTLLTTYDLMHGDLTFGDRFDVPRRVHGLTGSLQLVGKGKVDIFAVMIFSKELKLWRHPLFQGTRLNAEDLGEDVLLKPVDDKPMQVLLRQLLGLPVAKWASTYCRLTVLESVDPQSTHGLDTNAGLIDRAAMQKPKKQSAPAREPNNGGLQMMNIAGENRVLIEQKSDMVYSLLESNERYRIQPGTSGGIAHTLLRGRAQNKQEFRHRLEVVSDLNVVPTQETGTAPRALYTSAYIGRSVYKLEYHQKNWRRGSVADSTKAQDIVGRSDNYMERLFEGRMNSFPRLDTALIAHSHMLPLDLWEAESTEAFEEFADLERQRRRGTVDIKPMINFDPIDYLTGLAQETIDLEVFDDIKQAAAAGIQSAKCELGMDDGDGDVRSMRSFRPEVNVQVKANSKVQNIKAEQRLWFKMIAPLGYGEAEALLFYVAPEHEAGGDARRVYLMSTHVAQAGDTAFRDVFQSPMAHSFGYVLGAEPGGELFLYLAKPGQGNKSLSGENFFKRTRASSASFEMAAADMIDLQTSLLRRGPNERQVFRRKIAVSP